MYKYAFLVLLAGCDSCGGAEVVVETPAPVEAPVVAETPVVEAPAVVVETPVVEAPVGETLTVVAPVEAPAAK